MTAAGLPSILLDPVTAAMSAAGFTALERQAPLFTSTVCALAWLDETPGVHQFWAGVAVLVDGLAAQLTR